MFRAMKSMRRVNNAKICKEFPVLLTDGEVIRYWENTVDCATQNKIMKNICG